MPPKVSVSREMIISAAFGLVREKGIDALSVKAVAGRLGCSTQPVMYNFSTVEELRREVYARADEFHSAFILPTGEGDPMPELGLRYIRFAHEEGPLFRFLFQSDKFTGMNVDALVEAPELDPIIAMLESMGAADARSVFRRMFIMAHGYASLLANNAVSYDEEQCAADLRYMFRDAFGKGE